MEKIQFLTSGESICVEGGEKLVSNNGEYEAMFDDDRVFCLYHIKNHEREIIWKIPTNKGIANVLTMQDDGNLVMYDKNICPIWSTDTFIDATESSSELGILCGCMTLFTEDRILWDNHNGKNHQTWRNGDIYEKYIPIEGYQTYDTSKELGKFSDRKFPPSCYVTHPELREDSFKSNINGRVCLCTHRHNYSIHSNRPKCVRGPDLLLDLHKMEVVDGKKILDYFCLSHRWTGVPPKCEMENKEICEKGWLRDRLFFLREISESIKYIWVDVVCIRQWDDAHKLQEIGNMREYYSNAKAVLVWSDTLLTNQEFCGYYGNITFGLSTKNIPIWSEPNKEPTPAEIALERGRIETMSITSDDGWLNRIWTLQEVLLSDKCIIYSKWAVCNLYCVTAMIGELTSFITLVDKTISIPTSSSAEAIRKRGLDEKYNIADISELLGLRKATLTNDHIYGILGLLNLQIDINYDEPFSDVGIRLIEKASDHGDYSWLGVGNNKHSVNNWVPDLYSSKIHTNNGMIKSNVYINSGKIFPTKFTIENGNIIGVFECLGTITDEIHTCYIKSYDYEIKNYGHIIANWKTLEYANISYGNVIYSSAYEISNFKYEYDNVIKYNNGEEVDISRYQGSSDTMTKILLRAWGDNPNYEISYREFISRNSILPIVLAEDENYAKCELLVMGNIETEEGIKKLVWICKRRNEEEIIWDRLGTCILNNNLEGTFIHGRIPNHVQP